MSAFLHADFRVGAATPKTLAQRPERFAPHHLVERVAGISVRHADPRLWMVGDRPGETDHAARVACLRSPICPSTRAVGWDSIMTMPSRKKGARRMCGGASGVPGLRSGPMQIPSIDSGVGYRCYYYVLAVLATARTSKNPVAPCRRRWQAARSRPSVWPDLQARRRKQGRRGEGAPSATPHAVVVVTAV